MARFRIDAEEWLHILVSVITISLAFSLFRDDVFSVDYFYTVLLTVGLGFILHELAHKYVAISFGATAYFRAWTLGLVLALGMAFATQGQFVFAAPGAVYFHGRLSKAQVGKISIAGPLMNLGLAILFLVLAASVPSLQQFALLGAVVNAFLGAFNMVPFGVLDGAKVWAWNKGVWLSTFLAFFFLLFALTV
ncbi:site-2 protease family protein [Candidatus Micrarchaeota archaeon]|nr:site-2 protease family protein [Candidatus Micrarchaeota archaeon]